MLHTVLELIEQGATHVGVATDHVIERFATSCGRATRPAKASNRRYGRNFIHSSARSTQWVSRPGPCFKLKADDALASAAHLAALDPRVEKICIWTPDKDLAQCVQEDRIVQMDRKGKAIRNAKDVQEKFGVPPALIPDFLALVGDTADGYPGLEGIGKVGAARLVNKYGAIEKFPAEVLGAERWEEALLFKRLATLRKDAALFDNVDASNGAARRKSS